MKTSLTKQMMIANWVHALNVWLGEILITFETINNRSDLPVRFINLNLVV